MGHLKCRFDYLGLKINKGKIKDATFIHSDSVNTKADQPREK